MTGGTLHKVREVADHFRVTDRTVLDWIRNGQLEAVRLSSGKFRVTEEAMQKLIHPNRKKQAK